MLRWNLLAGGLTQPNECRQSIEITGYCQLRLATELSSSRGPDGATISAQDKARAFKILHRIRHL